ncbi:hypothetical protein [Actinomyces ruminicola]|nr:hypothetical protein [Actinomyces ruminicola]
MRFLEELTEDERCNASIPELMARVNESDIFHSVREWCESASIADLVDFRVEGYRQVEVLDEDLVVAAGEDATVWLCERLASTHLESWSGSSLAWELAYLDDPDGTAELMGVKKDVIRERAVGLVPVLDEITRRLHDFGVIGSVIDGLSNKQVVDGVVSLLRGGLIGDAVDLARRAFRRSPGDSRLAVVLARCLMAVDPEYARLILMDMLHDEVPQAVLVDLATLELSEGNVMDSMRYLGPVDVDDVDGWYWDPLDYCEHRMQFRYFVGNEWYERAVPALEGAASRLADS